MQPPPGYPQGPQDSGSQNHNQGPQPYNAGSQGYGPPPGPQGYGPPPGPPQYGMQRYPYYPPQKSGMPGWAIALIVCAVLVIPVGILALAAIPLITSNTRDARRAEGEQLMGTARDYLRVEYSKSGMESEAFRAFSSMASTGAFDGLYYNVDRTARPVSSPSFDAEVTCSPVKGQSDGHGQNQFRWADGSSQTTWK